MESLDAISASDLDDTLGSRSSESRGPNESIGLVRSLNDIVVLLLQMSQTNLLVPMKCQSNKLIILTEAA